MTFTCKHEADEPRNMGRGVARQKRLAEYFDRYCRDCMVEHIKVSVATLTHLDASPLTQDEQKIIADKRIANLRY